MTSLPATLYRRDSCALCEHAEQALRDVGVEAVARVDVGWDGELAQRYGWRIPVLRTADGRELDWPFDAFSVRRFLNASR
jgi:hypothetical protein